MTIEAVCAGEYEDERTGLPRHVFQFVVYDSSGTERGRLFSLIDAHALDDFVMTQERMRSILGQMPSVLDKSFGIKPGSARESFGEKWTREERNMDNGGDKDDKGGNDVDSHPAPRIRYEPKP